MAAWVSHPSVIIYVAYWTKQKTDGSLKLRGKSLVVGTPPERFEPSRLISAQVLAPPGVPQSLFQTSVFYIGVRSFEVLLTWVKALLA